MVVATHGETGWLALRRAYTARLDLAREPHRDAGEVVGLIGNTIPVELVLACGRVPTLVTADRSRPTPNAATYIEDVISPETRALFESAATGELEFLGLLVLSRSYSQLYYYLKEVYRLGRGPRFPPLHMFDLMQSQREAVRAYNWGRFEAFIARLERLSGCDITERRLREAIALTNAVRALQRRILDLRWIGRVSGVDALTALGASYFMSPTAYAAAVDGYLENLSPRADFENRPKLLVVTSEPLSHTSLHATLEGTGAVVVAEDDWWGSRAPGSDVPWPARPARRSFANTGSIRPHRASTRLKPAKPGSAKMRSAPGWLASSSISPRRTTSWDGIIRDSSPGWRPARNRRSSCARMPPHLTAPTPSAVRRGASWRSSRDPDGG